jgi:predicted ribosome quality control (RQC) complex YloA/Tae2 family protein
MDIELDPRKSMRQNLSDKYAELRKLKEKKAGLLTAIEQTKKETEEIEKKEKTKAGSGDSKETKNPRALLSAKSSSKCRPQKKKSYWYAPFLTFVSSGGRRVVAGKNAKQNDELYSKHLAPADLFFHADIQGAPTVILKDGQKASEEEKKEAAQWAASYSSAWKVGAAAVDVFALPPGQVSKNDSGGYVGPGAFVLTGEREWFRQMPLKLRVGWRGEELAMQPALHPQILERSVLLSPGQMPKEETAKLLSARLGVKVEEIAPLLPGGKFVIE